MFLLSVITSTLTFMYLCTIECTRLIGSLSFCLCMRKGRGRVITAGPLHFTITTKHFCRIILHKRAARHCPSVKYRFHAFLSSSHCCRRNCYDDDAGNDKHLTVAKLAETKTNNKIIFSPSPLLTCLCSFVNVHGHLTQKIYLSWHKFCHLYVDHCNLTPNGT